MTAQQVTCPRCHSARSRVYKTHINHAEQRIERHRHCLACDREWVTGSAIPVEYFLRNKPSLRRRLKKAV